MNILLPGFFHCPLLKVKTLSLGHPWRNKKKNSPNGRSKDIKRIHKYFRSWRSQTCQAKKSSNLIGSIQKLTVFSTNKPSRPLSGSDLPSSLLQLSISPPWCSSQVEYNWRGLWISSTPKYLGSKLTNYKFPAFLWFAPWSCSVVPFQFPSYGMLCYLGSTLAYLTSPPCSTKPPGTQHSKRGINIHHLDKRMAQ